VLLSGQIVQIDPDNEPSGRGGINPATGAGTPPLDNTLYFGQADFVVRVSRIFSIEFLTLGAVAGLLGALLAGGFTNIVLTRLLESKYHIDWPASVICVVATALLANLAGWLASFRILRQKPLEILREE